MAANKFFHDLLDLDTYLPKGEGKWPSLKLVFDNLRCYLILAIFGVAMRFLGKSPDILGTSAFWFLLPIFLLLFLATLAQTAVLLAVLSLGIVSNYFQPSERVASVLIKHEKLVQALAIIFLERVMDLYFGL